MNIFFLIRLFIGTIFLVSGIEKLITPYQNFLYVIQNYELLPDQLALITAKVLPWFELFVGVFLVLGFWMKQACIGASGLFIIFIAVVSQALIRNLPIVECGCFGELISLPLYVVLMMDMCLLFLTIWLMRHINKAKKFSLDVYFEK